MSYMVTAGAFSFFLDIRQRWEKDHILRKDFPVVIQLSCSEGPFLMYIVGWVFPRQDVKGLYKLLERRIRLVTAGTDGEGTG